MIRPTAILSLLALPVGAEPPGLLSIDITTLAGEDHAAALSIARAAGATVTSLSLMWDEMETSPGTYAPAVDWPAIANAYYPAEGMALTLGFSVIDTVADRRPAELRDKSWDDPDVIARFREHLAAVLSRMPDVDLKAIAIGNEVDAHLATPDQIADFAGFLSAARAEVERLRPGLPVAAKLTAAGLLSDPSRWQPILEAGSGVFVTYYPLDPDFSPRPSEAPATDLPRLVAIAAGKPLFLLEAGYPSGGCGATPAAQAAFVQSLFAAWEARRDAIPLVSLTWLTDLGPDEVAAGTAYYGITAPCFASYLATLGLRDGTGAPKPALEFLMQR